MNESINDLVQNSYEATDPDGPPLEEQYSRAAYAEEAHRELCRQDFLEFCKRFYPIAGLAPKFMAGWVHRDIAMRLMRFMHQVEREERPRLMLLMPPRHGKSSLVSIMFYCWVLGHHPEWDMFNVGYNEDLPLEFSKAIRQVLEHEEYRLVFPNTITKRDDRAADHWGLTAGGGMRAAGLRGGITGHGAHIFGIDDPLKGDEEADSEIHRNKLWSGFKFNIRTRMAPGGGVLIVQTWWHDDDLAGRIQEMNKREDAFSKYRDKYEIIRYPAITDKGEWEYRDEETLEIIRFRDEDDPPYTEEELDDFNYVLLRGPEEALHPERYSYEELMAIRADVIDEEGERVWNALFQQNPVPDSGTFFTKKMLVYVDTLPPPEGTHVVTGWDFAIGEKKKNNFTAGVTIQQHWGGAFFVRNVRRFKKGSKGIVEAMVKEAKFYIRMPDPPYYEVAVEDGMIWKSIQPYVKDAFEKAKIPWSIVKEIVPITDKQARATPLQGKMEALKVKLLKAAHWVAPYVREFMKFPNTKDKDQVDAAAHAMRRLLELGAPQLPADTEDTNPDRWRDRNIRTWREKIAGLGKRGGSHMSS